MKYSGRGCLARAWWAVGGLKGGHEGDKTHVIRVNVKLNLWDEFVDILISGFVVLSVSAKGPLHLR